MKRRTHHRPVLSRERHFIRLDQAPLLREAREQCRAATRKLEKARDQLRLFEEDDLPAYRQWMSQTFGLELTEIRELEEKRDALASEIDWIEREAYETGCSKRAAYLRLLDRRWQHAEDPKGFEEREREEQRRRIEEEREAAREEMNEMFEAMFGSRAQWRGNPKTYDDLYQSFKSEFEPVFGEEEQESDEDFYRAEPFAAPSATLHDASQEARIKALYRQLARKLHPDANHNLSPRERELWHEVQAAYDAQDLGRLETLAAMGDLFEDSIESTSRLSVLKKALLEIQASFREVQRALRRNRKDPAWGFARNLRDSNPAFLRVRAQVARELSEVRAGFQDIVAELEAIIRRWSEPPKPRKPRARGNRPGRKPGRGPWPEMTKAEMDAFTGFGAKKKRRR